MASALCVGLVTLPIVNKRADYNRIDRLIHRELSALNNKDNMNNQLKLTAAEQEICARTGVSSATFAQMRNAGGLDGKPLMLTDGERTSIVADDADSADSLTAEEDIICRLIGVPPAAYMKAKKAAREQSRKARAESL